MKIGPFFENCANKNLILIEMFIYNAAKDSFLFTTIAPSKGRNVICPRQSEIDTKGIQRIFLAKNV
jgi:hypothetical protein